MTIRRLARISLIVSLLIQAALVGTYGWATRWCFCSFTGFPSPRPLPDHQLWFLQHASLVPRAIRMPYFGDLLGVSADVDAWIGMALLVSINAFVWFDVIFFSLLAVVFLCRIRIGDGTDGLPRIRLVDPDAVRGRTVAAVPIALLLLGMTGGAVYRGWWMAEAERALHASFEALRTESEGPRGVNVWWMDASDSVPSSVFAGPYVVGRDRDAPRDRFLDRFVPPGTWMGAAHFAGGARYRFFVSRENGQWAVSVEEAND